MSMDAKGPRLFRAAGGRTPSPGADDARLFRDAALTLAVFACGLLALVAAAQPGSQQFNGPSRGDGRSDGSEYRRQQMVEKIRRGGITDERLLGVMAKVPRHLFVPEFVRQRAYDDAPVQLDAPGLSLPQAFVSARMISLLELRGREKVLEVGTGSGYDSALLSRLVDQVYTIEIDAQTADRAKKTLRGLGYQNIDVRVGDGYRGWPDAAPFDAILVTAAPKIVPEPLFEQLAVGGRMVVAVGFSLHQDLQVITKKPGGARETKRVSLISLAPMTGEIDQRP